MISIRLNKFLTKQQGFATLGITVVVLLAMTLISFFTAGTVLNEQKITTSVYNTKQTFDAAQAGLDFGVAYLNTNPSTVTDGMVVTGSLPNNSTYSLTYQFQGGTNALMKIVSTGTSSDGTATRTVEQLVKRVAGAIPSVPITAKGDEVEFENNVTITNLEGGKTILMGGSDIDIDDLAKTILASGTSSTSGSIGADIELNNAALADMNNAQLEMSVFGMPVSSLVATASITVTNSVSTNYNSLLNGVTGTTIYINQTGGRAELTGNTVVGLSASPVNIIVDGDARIKGSVIIYGNLIVIGEVKMSGNTQLYGLLYVAKGNDVEAELEGNAKIFGAIVFSGDEIEIEDNVTVTYDSAILESTLSTIGGYGKVPGSWKDVSSTP